MPARNLTDLPVELLSEIVNYLRPSLDDRPEIGVNAAWTEMDGPIYCEESEPSDESDEDTSEETDAQQDDHEVEIEGEGEGESEDENDDEDEVEVDATNPPTPTDSSRANTISVTEGSPEADEPNLQLSTYAVTTNSLGSNTKPMLKSEESLSPSNEVLAKGLASLFALRLTSSIFNAFCIPLIYQDLKLFKKEKVQDILDLAILPYSDSIKILRIAKEFPDEDIAQILHHTTKIKSIMFYDIGRKFGMPETMEMTGKAVVKLLTKGYLDSLGFYDSRILNTGAWAKEDLPDGPTQIIGLIGSNKDAARSLKRLDMASFDIAPSTYTIIRRQLPSIEFMSFHSTLTWNPLKVKWYYNMEWSWASYSHLQSIQFRYCGNVYAPDIPLLVRESPALKHLVVSVCGNPNDVRLPSPPEGWYHAADALWKVHEPLDTFQIEHMITWEIACMAEIPVKNLIIANLRADFLMTALEDDRNYFPGLQTIRIQPEKLSYINRGIHRIHPFRLKDLGSLAKYCEKRNVELRRDATATWLYPRHHF